MHNEDCGYDPAYWSMCVSRIVSKETLDELEKNIGECNIGILVIQIDDFYSLVGAYGEDAGLRLLDDIREEARELFHISFPHSQLLGMENAMVNETVMLFRLPEEVVGNLASQALAFRIALRAMLNSNAGDLAGQRVNVLVGHSWIGMEQAGGFHKALFKSFCAAQREAAIRPDSGSFEYHKEFVELLRRPSLTCLYQPIIDLGSGTIFGWEAFIRGPQGTFFNDPSMLFSYAEEIGKILALERKCRDRAIADLGRIASDQTLFLNVRTASLNDPTFSPSAMMKLLRGTDLKPQNIVFELSEKQGIQDPGLLLDCLDDYRSHGFRIALENVGSGHMSLQSISHIRPGFIKIDMSLVRGIDSNPIKRAMVEIFQILCEKIGSKMIVEGIETENELSPLLSMGVHYGQGYYICGPAYPKPSLCLIVPARASLGEGHRSDLCSTPIRGLVRPALEAEPQTAVRNVKKILADTPPMSSVVIANRERPVGLLMHYSLDHQLGTAYGVSLYFDREVSRLMDKHPLIVEADQPVEKVAKAAMNRENQRVYDDIIVTEKGVLLGTVSVQKMLDTLAKVQLEMAKGANPLTGLPGNVVIEQELSRRSSAVIASSLIYVDLDNFKVYNDAYGFESGDKVILFTSKVLNEVVNKEGASDDFIGHVGGDDFVVITMPERAERICKAIIAIFESEIPGFYNDMDRKRGYVLGKGRDGVERVFPLISVSLGIVECEFSSSFTIEELGFRVAEVKKYAKTICGNSYVKDRRAPIGSGSQPAAVEPPDSGKKLAG